MTTDNETRATKRYLCRYYHDGGWWSQTIDAYDWEDARRRASKLSMQLDGELVFTLSLPRWLGPLAPLVGRIIIAFHRFRS